MKPFLKPYLILLLLLTAITASAQTPADDAKKLIKDGVALHDAGKYADALEKYDQAIKLAPGNPNAYYEKGYTLMASGKGKEAIPVIEKLLQMAPNAAGAYDMLGSIYDDDKQFDKAIEYYKKGISVDSTYQRLYFNLSISYYRQQKYAEAEDYAISAIKHDPKHASSMRAYAMATYKEQKRDRSLLAWCSFLMMEPQTQRSAEANTYVKNILAYGIKKTGEKSVSLSVSPNETNPGNLVIQIAVLAATENKKDLTATDSLNLQLKSVFQVTAELAAKKPDGFYSNYLAKFFGDLANTGNMPAFARYISLSTNKDDNLAWFKAHPQETTDFGKWLKETKRSF